jgi:hypothetical protein
MLLLLLLACTRVYVCVCRSYCEHRQASIILEEDGGAKKMIKYVFLKRDVVVTSSCAPSIHTHTHTLA